MIGVALMRALFGRWRPRGTDITYPRDQRLHRKSRRASERARERERGAGGGKERERERERAFLLPKRRRRSRHFLRLADCKCRVCTSYVEREKVGGERGGGGGNRIASYLSSTRAGNSEPRQKGARNGRKLHASNANPRLTVPLPLVSYRTPPPPPPLFC